MPLICNDDQCPNATLPVEERRFYQGSGEVYVLDGEETMLDTTYEEPDDIQCSICWLEAAYYEEGDKGGGISHSSN